MSKATNRSALRPGRPCDAAAVANLWNRRAATREQPSVYTAADVEHRWSTPGFNVATDTRLAWDGEELLAYAHLRDVKEPHVDLFVGVSLDPQVENDDRLSDELYAWLGARAQESLARAPEGARVVLIDGAAADDHHRQEMLVRYGFRVDRVFSRLRLQLDRRPPVPTWPDGVVVREFRPGEDDVELVLAYRDAFQNHYGYLEQPLEAEVERWRHWMEQPDFEPSLWFLAVGTGKICGYCCTFAESHGEKECGLVDEFGVRSAWRRRGIGRALLLEAFGAMHARGLRAVELTVDTDNTSDALGVYTNAGMTPISQDLTFVKELRPGQNLVAS